MGSVRFLSCAVVLAGLLLAGCGHVPVTSIYKLRKFDPATTDLTQFRVAVRLPDGYRLQPGGAKVTLKLNDRGTNIAESETFHLHESDDPRDLQQLAPHRRAGTQLRAYRLKPNDLERFESLRAKAREARKSGEAKGSLSVDAAGCRIGDTPPKTLPVTTYIKSAETDGFVPLVVDYDLLSQGGDAGQIVPLCEQAGSFTR